MPLLEVEGLSVSLPVAGGNLLAVREVSVALERGETLCLVGESGCGKSLSAAAILGLLPARARWTARRLAFDGIDLRARRSRRGLMGRRIAAVFQDPMTALNPAYTVGDQLTEGMLHHLGLAHAEAHRRAVALLDRVGVPSPERRMGQYPHELSGGLRQRVTIAIALACGPDLVVADEPTTALDVTVQAQVLRLMADLQRETGSAMLLITHDLSVVAQMGHAVAVMYAGRVVESGPVADVLSAPRHPYTRALLACLPNGRGRGEPLGTIPGLVPTVLKAPAACTFADRCSAVQDACRRADPPTQGAGRRSWQCIQ